MSDIRCSNIHYNYDIEMCNWLLKHGAKAIGCGIHNKTGNTFIVFLVNKQYKSMENEYKKLKN